MSRRLTHLTLALILAASSLAGSSNNAAWIADIDHLAAELPRLHMNAFARISEETFTGAIQQLRSEVPSLADHEVTARILRVVAMIGDSHTAVYGGAFTRFPIALYWFSDGLYVTRAGEEHRDLLGAKLVSIDAWTVDDLVASVAPLIPHENEFWLRELAPQQLATPEILHALGLIPTLETATFRFTRRDGTPIDRVLERTPAGAVQWVEFLSNDQKPLYLRDTQTNYWFEYIPRSQTLFVQYNRCAEIPSKPMATFGAELGALARTHPIARLVLDLRHNPGGNSGLIVAMLSPLYEAAPELDDPNRFFVVIGPRTFSSAMMNAIEIDNNTKATLIGRPTGGKPNHFGNVRTFTLPNSNMMVQYSTRYYELVPGDPPAVMPEVEVGFPSAEYFAGRDPVMERIVPPLPRRRAVLP